MSKYHRTVGKLLWHQRFDEKIITFQNIVERKWSCWGPITHFRKKGVLKHELGKNILCESTAYIFSYSVQCSMNDFHLCLTRVPTGQYRPYRWELVAVYVTHQENMNCAISVNFRKGRNKWNLRSFLLKSVHFKKPVTRISFLSKALSFSI